MAQTSGGPVYTREGGPGTPGGQPPPKKRKKRTLPYIIIAVLVAVIIILLLLRSCGAGQGTGGWFDGNAQTGNLPGKTQEEIQAELDRIVEEGMFNISVAAVIYFENGQAEGLARIENIAANPYHMSVVITRDDTGDVLYESKGLRPGQYIEYIKLSQNLPAGSYAATATFTAHNQDSLESEGQAAAKVEIVVQN